MQLAYLSASIQSLPLLPTSKLGPSGADSGGSFCVPSRTLWVSPTNSPVEAGSFSCCLNPHRFLQLEVSFSCPGTLGCADCFPPQLFLLVYLHTNVGLPTLPAAISPCPPAIALPQVLSAWLPASAPPTGLDECFFFNFFVIRLPYSSIFCQFWLLFVFKFVVVLLLVVRGGTVYLAKPPSFFPPLQGLFWN